MRTIFWSVPAEADLGGIDDYWLARDGERADRLLDRVEKAAQRLRHVPEGGPLVGRENMRKWRVAGTPCSLLSRVRGEAIEILRVHHGAQDWRPE